MKQIILFANSFHAVARVSRVTVSPASPDLSSGASWPIYFKIFSGTPQIHILAGRE